MRVGAASAAKLLAQRIDLVADPRPVVDMLTELCLDMAWCAEEAGAREEAERLEEPVCIVLRRELSELHRLGRVAPYVFNSSSEYMLQGAAFMEPRDSAEVRAEKDGLSQLQDYLHVLQQLTPEDFEALCAGMLYEVGVQDPHLTRRTGDEGIDFYGRLKLEGLLTANSVSPGVERQLSVWMIGQAKRYYASAASTSHIRELVGAVELAKGQAFGSHGESYIEPRIRVCDPVFCLIFTTGRIALNAWRLIEKSGVIGMDGMMVAAFLSSRVTSTIPGDTVEERVGAWLSKFLRPN
jgi:hypothetical protein